MRPRKEVVQRNSSSSGQNVLGHRWISWKQDVLSVPLDSMQSPEKLRWLGQPFPTSRHGSHKPSNHKLRQTSRLKIDERHLRIDGDIVTNGLKDGGTNHLRHIHDELISDIGRVELLRVSELVRQLKIQLKGANSSIQRILITCEMNERYHSSKNAFIMTQLFPEVVPKIQMPWMKVKVKITPKYMPCKSNSGWKREIAKDIQIRLVVERIAKQ